MLLGNLIDNAIEACEKVEGEKFIRLYLGIYKKQLYMSITNATNEVVRKFDEEYISNKRGNHGHGLKRINKASDALGYNEGGLEGVYHHSTTLFGSVLGLAMYSLILTKVHPLIVLALLFLSAVQYVFHCIAERYERKHI